MHKKQLIKRDSKSVPQFFLGGLSPALMKGIAGLTANIGASTKQPGLNQDYTKANAGSNTNTDPMKVNGSSTGIDLNKGIQGSLSGLLTGIGGLSGIGNSGLNADQKRMMTADTVVDTASSIAGAFGPVGSAIGAGLGLVNKLGGMLMGTPKAMKDYKLNDQVATSSGYTGVAANAGDVKNSVDTYSNSGLFGKLFGGKNSIIGKTRIANDQANVVSRVLDQNKLAKDQMLSSDLNNQRNMNKLYGGNSWSNGSLQYGKEGGKLKLSYGGSIKETVMNANNQPVRTYEQYKKLLGAAAKINFKKIRMPVKTSDMKKDVAPNKMNIQKHAEGGVIEAPQNVIVDGALHAHLHDLKELETLEDANITLKGIPVVSQSEGGEITQHAEVERDELILHYECSKKLEELYEEGDEESMIEAGKLLAEELIKNTKDSANKILENA